MKRTTATILLSFFLLIFILPVCGQDGSTVTPTYISIGEPNVEVRDLTLIPDSVYPGGSIDFSVTLRNLGTVSTMTTIEIDVHDSADRVVGTITYDPVPLLPGQIATVQKTWGVGSLPTGNYRALAQASFNSNLSNLFEKKFSIARLPSPPNIPPSQNMGQLPVLLPSEITPVQGEIEFLRTTLLREVLAGEGALESVSLKNLREGVLNISLSFDGIPQEWASITSEKALILPDEIQIMNLGFSIPTETLAGDYLVRLHTSGGANSTDFLALRVKNYPQDYDKPIALKTIRIDESERKTLVSIEVKNPSKNTMELVQVQEKIPSGLKDSQIEFVDKQGTISELNGAKVITWELSNIHPQESFQISYNIRDFITDYSTYENWRISQILVTQRYSTADLIKVVDITSSGINDSVGEVAATLLYVGNDPLQVTIVLEAPAGFGVEPAAVTKMLTPKGVVSVAFKLNVPTTEQGTHMVRLVIMGEDFSTSTTAPIIIRREAPPPSFSLLSVLSVQEIIALSAVVAAGVAISVVSYRRVKHGRRPQYDPERLNYLKDIKGMVVGKKHK